MTMRTRPIADAIVFRQDTTGGTTLIEYQPGNGTRYIVLFTSTLAFDQDALDRLGWSRGTVLVQVLNLRDGKMAYPSAPGGFIHPGYLREKMGLSYDADAYVLAELIAHVLPGREAASALEQEDGQDGPD